VLPKLSGKSGSGLSASTTSAVDAEKEGVIIGRDITVGVDAWERVDPGGGKTVELKVGEVGAGVGEFGWAPAGRVFSVERGGEAGMGVVVRLAPVHPRRMSKVSNMIRAGRKSNILGGISLSLNDQAIAQKPKKVTPIIARGANVDLLTGRSLK
jgi:hypothetical protein